MTYLELIRDADRQLDDGRITIGEYEQMIEPLEQEIQPEIIFCIDCKWWRKGEEIGWGLCSIHTAGSLGYRVCQSCDFCSWAERRTDK